MRANTYWRRGSALVAIKVDAMTSGRIDELSEAYIPDPPTGLVVTRCPKGKGYRVTHSVSGYAIGRTSFPLVVAKKVCRALAEIAGVDWTQPIEHLLADRARLKPLVIAAAEPFATLEISSDAE